MKLKALERQTGDYGVVNAGDTVIVSDSVGKELLANGTFEKASDTEEMATPEEVSQRNVSGLQTEPAGFDGREREAQNTEGRRLVEQDALTDAAQKDKEVAQKELVEAGKRQTKENKEAAKEATKDAK